MDACFLCREELGTVPLTCKKHSLCVTCLKKNAKDKQLRVEDIDRCPAKECATSLDPAEQCATSQDPIWIFADNSNIWIGAKNLGKKTFRTGRQCEDHRIRIDYGSLMAVVAKERRVVGAFLYGSKPPENDSLWNKARERGWKVDVKRRSSVTNQEKQVDAQITADIVELLKLSKQGTIVLITGDADFIPAVKKVVKYRTWKIEVGVWKSIQSHCLTSLAEKYENVSEINLDDDWDNIVYSEKEFSAKHSIPTSSSAVLTIQPDSVSTIESWWKQIEEVTQWPVQYKWIKGTEHHLLLVFGRGLKPRNIESLKKDLKKISHVQSFEMFDDYDRRQTLENWQPASGEKGLDIAGTFVRCEGQIYANMTFVISNSKAQRVMRNLTIEFSKNSFGLTIAAPGPLSLSSANRSASSLDLLPVVEGGPVMKMTPLTQLQVAVKNNVDVFHFSTNVPMHVLFAEDGEISCKTFQKWWGGVKDSYKKQVHNVSLTEAQIKKRLKDNNVFLIKEWQDRIKHDHMYMSLKLINGIWVLMETTIAHGTSTIEFIFKTKVAVPEIISGIHDSFERHILHSYI